MTTDYVDAYRRVARARAVLDRERMGLARACAAAHERGESYRAIADALGLTFQRVGQLVQLGKADQAS